MNIEAINILKQACHDLAPAYYGTDEAPNSWRDLKAYTQDLEQGKAIPVFSGASEHTIYGDDHQANVAFRAWHDKLHLKHGLSFEAQDEKATARKHVLELRQWAKGKGLCSQLVELAALYVYADIVAQVDYYFDKGDFCHDQKAVVEQWLAERGA